MGIFLVILLCNPTLIQAENASLYDAAEASFHLLPLLEQIIDSKLENFEDLMVSRYGLVRRCLPPHVKNGIPLCKKDRNSRVYETDLAPGSICKVICNVGYISTPGREWTRCLDGGVWEVKMNCEIPLVIVSGGFVDSERTADSSVEVISLYNSSGCDISIPDMPVHDNEIRTLHNLLYSPKDPRGVLACNGITKNPLATCDFWGPDTDVWKSNHSYPNVGGLMSRLMRQISKDHEKLKDYQLGKDETDHPERTLSRYAASALNVDEKMYIAGGMVNTKKEHVVVASVRRFNRDSWDHHKHGRYPKTTRNMETRRSFFCTVPIYDIGFVAIGGFSGEKMETSGEFVKTSEHWKHSSYSKSGKHFGTSILDMPETRSGLGCTGILMDDLNILVSGGTNDEESLALNSTLMYSVEYGHWIQVGEMNQPRFGHALVTVGDKVAAIGGNERRPDEVTASIEEYNSVNRTWSYMNLQMKKPRTNFGFTLVPHSIFEGCKIYGN